MAVRSDFFVPGQTLEIQVFPSQSFGVIKMAHSHTTSKIKITGVHFLLSFILVLSLPALCFALTPIAHTDVVPYQRIEYGGSFTFGVVAFSKAGINRVEFAISGQGYSGGTKTSSAMELNTRHAHTEPAVPMASWPGVYEYFVTISASEFTSNGTISVTPTVVGNDGGSRVLGSTTLIVEGANATNRNYAYVNPSTGSDSCQANTTDRCRTIERAVQVAQAANGGNSSGNIIYLDAGNYTAVGSHTTSTSGEWLTIKNAPGASRDNIIISDSGTVFDSADHLKFEGVSLYASSYGDNVINGTVPNLWVDGCKLYSPSRLYNDPDTGNGDLRPIQGSTKYYATETFATEVDRAFSDMTILRNATIYRISEDVTRNSNLVVNTRVDDQDPEDALAQYPHADSYQQFGTIGNNVIVYNYYGTDLHYQGLFLRGGGNDEAFVNVFMEMREPGRYGRPPAEGGNIVFNSGALYVEDNNWDHILIWHCSFPYQKFAFWGLDKGTVNFEMTNSSIIGSIFYEFVANSDGGCIDPPSYANGNTKGNEALYNHYYSAAVDVGSPCCSFNASNCPHFQSKSPDSGSPATQSHGGRYHAAALDLTDTSTYVDFGYPDPNTGAILIDRLPTNLTGVPADVFGYQRDATPDVGAIESIKSILPPKNLKIKNP